MKRILSALFVSSVVLGTPPSNACDSTTTYTSWNDYVSDMTAKNLPVTLVVGCGHHPSMYSELDNGDHTHPNCWCVNLDDEKKYAPSPNMVGGTSGEVPFWQSIQANEMLDITSLSSSLCYQNQFDVTLLERPFAKTLNHPWTLFNAARMLKVGGELVIDTIPTYSTHLYDMENSSNPFWTVCSGFTSPSLQKQYPDKTPQHNLFKKNWQEYLEEFNIKKFNINAINSLGSLLYGESFSSNNISKKLNQFDIKPDGPIRIGRNTEMGDYLANWFFTDIVCVENAYQPYTKIPGGSITTARKTIILSATKTKDIQDVLDDWKKAISNVVR